MNLRRILIVLLALGVGATVILLWPTEPLSPSEQVRRRIVQLSAAAQARELGDVNDAISRSFRSPQGQDRDDVRRIIAAHLLRGQYLKVFTDVKGLTERSDEEVLAELNAYFARAEVDDVKTLARDSVMSAWRLEVTFRLEDGEWMATSAEWRRLSPGELF